jgi:hypothetical protein
MALGLCFSLFRHTEQKVGIHGYVEATMEEKPRILTMYRIECCAVDAETTFPTMLSCFR